MFLKTNAENDSATQTKIKHVGVVIFGKVEVTQKVDRTARLYFSGRFSVFVTEKIWKKSANETIVTKAKLFQFSILTQLRTVELFLKANLAAS